MWLRTERKIFCRGKNSKTRIIFIWSEPGQPQSGISLEIWLTLLWMLITTGNDKKSETLLMTATIMVMLQTYIIIWVMGTAAAHSVVTLSQIVMHVRSLLFLTAGLGYVSRSLKYLWGMVDSCFVAIQNISSWHCYCQLWRQWCCHLHFLHMILLVRLYNNYSLVSKIKV